MNYTGVMDRDSIVARLQEHEAELRELGICRLSLFGSVARGEGGPGSDVDVAVTLDRSRRLGLFHYAGISERLSELLHTPVDLLSEPARKPRLQAEVDRDRVRVF